MKVRACIRRKVSVCLPKYSAIFLFLAVFVFIFVLRKMDFLEHKVNSTIILPRVSTDPDMHRHFPRYKLQSPKEALEERLLLDSIAWPETPVLPSPLSLEKTSDPAHSTFTILPGRGGGQWHVGDQLEAMIKMYDFQGRPKKSGGDVLLARLHNPTLGAGVAGQVVDHLNGSFSAVFSLLWEGRAQVEVMLVHPSEAVTVLRRLNIEQPDRVYFESLFRSGSVSETTTCNICLRPNQQPLCNYTDLRTGEPWFCYKPKNLNCDARIIHHGGGCTIDLKAKEEKLFQSGVNMKVSIPASGPASVTVLPKKEGQPEVEGSSVKSGPSGYYYQGVWRALGGTTVRQFKTSSDISQCLKGKVVHMYGDSTIRQWFEHLKAAQPGLKQLHKMGQSGPFMALDYVNNIFVTYRCHGPPLQFAAVYLTELNYIANELDGIKGGTNTVVIIGIWAHFSSYPMEVYTRRLQSIRSAVVRLLDRAPGTLVVIRTGNPRDLTLRLAIQHSDWYALQCDKVLRAVFKGLPVRLVDAWEMIVAHHLPHNVHPGAPIIKNMIDIVLSFICPQKSG